MDLTAAALVAGGLALVVVILGTAYSRRLRARGRRVPAAITSNVALGWVLIVVTTVLLVSNAITSH